LISLRIELTLDIVRSIGKAHEGNDSLEVLIARYETMSSDEVDKELLQLGINPDTSVSGVLRWVYCWFRRLQRTWRLVSRNVTSAAISYAISARRFPLTYSLACNHSRRSTFPRSGNLGGDDHGGLTSLFRSCWNEGGTF